MADLNSACMTTGLLPLELNTINAVRIQTENAEADFAHLVTLLTDEANESRSCLVSTHRAVERLKATSPPISVAALIVATLARRGYTLRDTPIIAGINVAANIERLRGSIVFSARTQAGSRVCLSVMPKTEKVLLVELMEYYS